MCVKLAFVLFSRVPNQRVASLVCSSELSEDGGVELESEEELSGSRSSLERQSHRGNTTVHVCWHRNTSVSMVDFSIAVEVTHAAFLTRCLSGWVCFCPLGLILCCFLSWSSFFVLSGLLWLNIIIILHYQEAKMYDTVSKWEQKGELYRPYS